MKKTIFIITTGCFMVAWICCTIEKASGKESKIKNTLTLEKIETLSSPESQEVPPCIVGNGYCFKDAKTSTFVIATGLYPGGRYLYYSLTDQSERYFLTGSKNVGFVVAVLGYGYTAAIGDALFAAAKNGGIIITITHRTMGTNPGVYTTVTNHNGDHIISF